MTDNLAIPFYDYAEAADEAQWLAETVRVPYAVSNGYLTDAFVVWAWHPAVVLDDHLIHVYYPKGDR